jgi:hypothetical protein
MTGPTVWWSAIITPFERNHDDLIAGHPDCIEEIELLRTALLTIGQLIHISPPVNGNGAMWKELIATAEAERTVLCKHLDSKALFTAMLRLYAAIHREMCDSVLPEQKELTEEFREQRRCKRTPSEEPAKKSKTIMPTPGQRDPWIRFQGPLRASEMDVEHTLVEETTDKPNREPQQPSSNKSGRPPPIVLSTTTKLTHLRGISEALSRAILSSATPGAGPELSRKNGGFFSYQELSREQQPFLFYLLPEVRKTPQSCNSSPSPKRSS